MDENLSESDGQHVPGGLSRAITNVRHLVHSLEPPANTVVNTLGLAPVSLQLSISVALNKSKWLTRIQITNCLTNDQILGRLRTLVTWWRVNFLVRFLTILGLEAGVIAMLEPKW